MVGKAAKITKEVLESHFHLPMADVAKKFHVCLTYFKKVCRSHGVKRWPYRKLKSLQHKSSPIEGEASDRSSYGCGASDSDEREVDSDYAFQSAPSSPSLTEHSEDRGIKRSREEAESAGPSAMDVLAMFATTDREDGERPVKRSMGHNHAEVKEEQEERKHDAYIQESTREATQSTQYGMPEGLASSAFPILPSMGSLMSVGGGQPAAFPMQMHHNFTNSQQAFIAQSTYLSQHMRTQPYVNMGYGFA